MKMTPIGGITAAGERSRAQRVKLAQRKIIIEKVPAFFERAPFVDHISNRWA
ncbi:MAG: hypothetical protein PUB00_05180 [Clostridiales bacterium]|nr:hypothetical protein [Clostridiales bacterium]